MKYIIIASLSSLILQSYLTTILKIDTIFYPLFLIVNLIVLYKYFNKDNLKFIIYALTMGFISETISSNTIFLQPILFLLISFIVIYISNRIEVGNINLFLIVPFIITIYRILSYFILNNIVHISITNQLLYQSIYSSIVINILYAYTLNYIFKFISNKYKFSMYD